MILRLLKEVAQSHGFDILHPHMTQYIILSSEIWQASVALLSKHL